MKKLINNIYPNEKTQFLINDRNDYDSFIFNGCTSGSCSRSQLLYLYLFRAVDMEGNAAIKDTDKVGINPRFQVMDVSSDDSSHNGRIAGEWYTAVPPLCRWNTGLTCRLFRSCTCRQPPVTYRDRYHNGSRRRCQHRCL